MPDRPPADWVRRLVRWFAEHRREMPWRDSPHPYHVWISEVMLQQTQVETVKPYFSRFVELFPTVDALANADSQAVLKAWEGLGYYSRARNLHAAAKQIVAEYAGELPKSAADLQALPGVGPYISAAVAAIAFGEAVPVVDGNVLRVFARFFGLRDDISKAATHAKLAARLTPFVGQANPADFNQAMMEVGALICRPTMPNCPACPLKAECIARNENLTATLPIKAKKKATPHKQIAVGVVWKNGKILIGRRRTDQMLGGLWEFPGGKIEAGENAATAAIREVKEETGLTVTAAGNYIAVEHAYSHFSITLTAVKCEWQAGRVRAKSADELKWVTLAQLDEFPFPAANKKVIAAIRAAHETVSPPRTTAMKTPTSSAKPKAKTAPIKKANSKPRTKR